MALQRQFAAGEIDVQIYADKQRLGKAAAEFVAGQVGDVLQQRGAARVIFATGASQYEFLAGVCQTLDTIYQTIREIRTTRTQLNELKKTVIDSTFISSIKDILDKGKAIEENLHQTKTKSDEDMLNFPVMLDDKISNVGGLADWGFNRPTEAMYGVKKALEKAIDDQLDAWKKVKEQIKTLNEDLNRAKVPYINTHEKG